MRLTRALGVLVAQLAGLCLSAEALAQTYSLEQLIPPASQTVGPFPTEVAIDGNTAVVASNDETVNGGLYTGAVYVYVKNAASWVLQQRIDGQVPQHHFGWSVALSGDTLAIADFDGGNVPVSSTVFVYLRTGSTWALQAQIATGYRPVVRLQGNTLLVGSQSASSNPVGAARVYERTGATWSSGTTLPAPGVVAQDFFGSVGAISNDTICVGTAYSPVSGGSVRVYARSGSGWALQQKLTAQIPAIGDAYGFSCAVDGDTLVVGARFTGPPRNILIGGYVYVRSGGTWTLQQEIIGSNAAAFQLGLAVAVKGDVAVVGGDGFSVFRRNGTTWAETQSVPQPSSYAENSVSIDGASLRLMTSQLGQGARIYTFGTTPSGAPSAPMNVQATATGNTLNLTWGAPASGAAPTSYTLLARTAAGAAPVVTVPLGAVTSFAATAPNGTFLLSLTATNAVGTGPESAITTVTFPGGAVAPPASPTGFGASVIGTTATFTWTAPVSGGAPTGYVLLAGTTPGFASPFASLPLPVSPNSVSIPGVPPGTYYIRLVAQNAGGTSGPSNEVTLTVAGASAPGAPTLSASATGSTVNVSWTAGSGGAPTSYTLNAAVTPGGAPVATVPLGGTSASFANVPSGTYYLRLTASNGAGTSPASNQVTVTVP